MEPVTRAQPQNVAYTRNDRGEYHVSFEPYHGRVRAVLNGKAVADSSKAMVLREGRLPPVWYFPREDVRMDLMEPTERRTHCPFRGHPVYFTVTVGARRVENAAWSYEEPYPESAYVRDYVAFYREALDEWLEEPQAGVVEPARISRNPLIDWLAVDAWQARSLADLVARWVETLRRARVPLMRFALITRSLHPLLAGSGYRWEKGEEGVKRGSIGYEVLETSRYLDSPLVPIFEGAGGLRRRLDDDSGGDFPVTEEIRALGGTDYVAMPLVFSDGQINAVTLATDAPGGFDVIHLAQINEALPLFGRLVEVFEQREKSRTLLKTYLGAQSGGRVLDGLVRRGDAEDIHAVIWFCDLRDSSAMAASMSRARFLKHLNAFFDCMAGAVLDNDGEVLRFIGDAALAIFPFSADDAEDGARACARAVRAARDALERVAAFNEDRADADARAIRVGIGLHVGDVTYGNIGTRARLEFTVIGAAANEAARVESLCKELDAPVIVSRDFVEHCPGEYRSLGVHGLRGAGRELELFAPQWSGAAPRRP